MSTAPDAADVRLRGRAYAIPFGEVWSRARALADERRGWRRTGVDARSGEIRFELQSRFWRVGCDLVIRVSLDEVGLTRVDVLTGPRRWRPDLGAGQRRISAVLRTLDRALGLSR